jgi:hypothetical protein
MPTTIRSLTLAAAIAAALSCRTNSVAPSPGSSIALASDTIVVSGTTLRLRVFLGRNFMPSDQPDTRLGAVITLVPESGAVPTGLRVEHATFFLGPDKWDVVPKQGFFPSACCLEVGAGGGPLWPVGSRVDAIVQVKDGSGRSYWLRVNGAVIERRD